MIGLSRATAIYQQRSSVAATLAIVGFAGGTHIGSSLALAAAKLATNILFFDVAGAGGRSRLLSVLSRHLGDRRPQRLTQFSNEVVKVCAQSPPDVLVTTGTAALDADAVRALNSMGVICINYATDDPWNPKLRANWYLRALPAYDLVFTPRQANLNDFRQIGCPDIRYLPFAYDDILFAPPEEPSESGCDVLFVGGADKDRVKFMKAFMRTGPPVALCGGYWERYPAMRSHARGLKRPEELCRLTAAAKVNLCLVRRANRDGHVMRTFEIAAIGGCMLVEDTEDHRIIFGSDGEAVLFFRTPEEAAERAQGLIAQPSERSRLARSVRDRIRGTPNTYLDRLRSMLDAASALRRDRLALEPR